MSHRFFIEGNWSKGQVLTLDPDQAHHALRVLRLAPGNAIDVFNGEGLIGTGCLVAAGVKSLQVEISEVCERSRIWKLTVAFSLAKPSATEFILKRLTELGVRSFQPLRSQYSHPGDFRPERWRKILLEVCKQCQETHLPVLEPTVTLSEWMSRWNPRPILVCDETDRGAAPQGFLQSEEVAVLVGPEGGWDAAELQLFDHCSAVRMGLGRNRLRAETAALVSATLAKSLLGELPCNTRSIKS